MAVVCKEDEELVVIVTDENGDREETCIDFIDPEALGESMINIIQDNDLTKRQVGEILIRMIDDANKAYLQNMMNSGQEPVEITQPEPLKSPGVFSGFINKYPKTSVVVAALLGGGGALLVKSSYKKFK